MLKVCFLSLMAVLVLSTQIKRLSEPIFEADLQPLAAPKASLLVDGSYGPHFFQPHAPPTSPLPQSPEDICVTPSFCADLPALLTGFLSKPLSSATLPLPKAGRLELPFTPPAAERGPVSFAMPPPSRA